MDGNGLHKKKQENDPAFSISWGGNRLITKLYLLRIFEIKTSITIKNTASIECSYLSIAKLIYLLSKLKLTIFNL